MLAKCECLGQGSCRAPFQKLINSPSAKLPVDRMSENSYVNRPFPLEEAAEHWARLRSWGLTFSESRAGVFLLRTKLTPVRINVTWDAIEHAGPGVYDKDYLAYLRALLESLRGTGLVAYIVSDLDD